VLARLYNHTIRVQKEIDVLNLFDFHVQPMPNDQRIAAVLEVESFVRSSYNMKGMFDHQIGIANVQAWEYLLSSSGLSGP
jgi:hypothetical protein